MFPRVMCWISVLSLSMSRTITISNLIPAYNIQLLQTCVVALPLSDSSTCIQVRLSHIRMLISSQIIFLFFHIATESAISRIIFTFLQYDQLRVFTILYSLNLPFYPLMLITPHVSSVTNRYQNLIQLTSTQENCIAKRFNLFVVKLLYMCITFSIAPYMQTLCVRFDLFLFFTFSTSICLVLLSTHKTFRVTYWRLTNCSPRTMFCKYSFILLLISFQC